MKKLALGLIASIFAFNAQAVVITWDLTNMLYLEHVEHYYVYVVWGEDQTDHTKNFHDVWEKLRDGTFQWTNSSAESQIAGYTPTDDISVGSLHQTDILGLDDLSHTYKISLLILCQFTTEGMEDRWDGNQFGYWMTSSLDYKLDMALLGPIHFSHHLEDFLGYFNPVPEPTTGLLVALGGAALLLRRRKRG